MHFGPIDEATGEPLAFTSTLPSITFESLTFSDGTTIELDRDDIVLFVGPNNAGKSEALRDLQGHIGGSGQGTVVKSAKLRKIGTVDGLRNMIRTHFQVVDDPNGTRYVVNGANVWEGMLEHHWQHPDQLRDIFCRRIATERRIVDSNPASAINILNEKPWNPIHILFADDRVEKRISDYFRRAFGKDLILFRVGGQSWPFLVGDRPEIQPGEDRISATYNQRLRAATVPLEHQGDGMRSFATVILEMLAPDTPSVLLLDEPEAFLHPPQARLLGEFIAKERPRLAQLFIATHSPDVLQGLLNAAPDHLRVVRVKRDGNINRAKELDKSRAKKISGDPIMKFTSVLSGVFHQRVIICESDADCMFYSSVLDIPAVHGSQFPDVLFVQAGGKHRMATLAEALRSLDVDVDVIADFDLLNDESVVEGAVKALGGDWAEVRTQVGPLKAAIEQRKPWLNAVEVAKGIREILDKIPSAGEFPRTARADIESLFRKASPWDAIKTAGEAAVPGGDATKHYGKLQALCNAFGLWIVPVGELEGFCRFEGRHGPLWVQRVVENHDLATDPKLSGARAFIRQVWDRLAPDMRLNG
jgi:hypothetical protein